MINLFVTLKGRTVGRFDFDAGPVRLGRHPDNEVQIDSMAVSRFHCVLQSQGTDWFVEDLGSNNGTYLNGSRVQRAAVRMGDALGVGQFQVSVRTHVPGKAEPETAESLPVLAFHESPEMLEHSAPVKAYLEFRDQPGPPLLIERDVVQFGSARGVDLEVQGAGKRAILVRGYGGFQLLNPTEQPEGVRVDGVAVADRMWIDDGAELEIGSLCAVFRLGLPSQQDSEGERTIEVRLSELGNLQQGKQNAT